MSMRPFILIALMLIPSVVCAQEAPKSPWSFSAKLTAVWAAGNSESSTLGAGGTVRYALNANEFKLEASGIRTESAIKTRYATGSLSSFEVHDSTVRQTTAESYGVRGRYDRKLSDRFLVYSGAEWLRNTFAGIDSRLLFAAGAGNIWADREDFRFKTDYGVTYTVQEDVIDDPAVSGTFPGLRASWDLMRKLTTTTLFESVLIGDVNLDTTDDVRVDFTNGLSLAVTSGIAFKPALQLLWRNQPSLTAVQLISPLSLGLPTGQMVLVPLEKLDSFFTLAVVATF